MLLRHCVTIAMATALVGTFALDARCDDAKHSENLVNDPSLEGLVGENGLPAGWGGVYPSPAESYKFSVVAGGRTYFAAVCPGWGAHGGYAVTSLIGPSKS
jgi:hypothetical protein